MISLVVSGRQCDLSTFLVLTDISPARIYGLFSQCHVQANIIKYVHIQIPAAGTFPSAAAALCVY